MSGFFESEVVKSAIKEMEELQQEIIEATFSAPLMTPEQKREHIDLMKTFLEKQKNLYFRLTLSDDPEAVSMKERMKDAAELLGFSGNNIDELFATMEETLDRIDTITEED